MVALKGLHHRFYAETRRRSGLRVFMEQTHGKSPVMRNAVAAFGFVYIHPLADGNGLPRQFNDGDDHHRTHPTPRLATTRADWDVLGLARSPWFQKH